eukprot:TRINITY_DN14423_c0_g1_i1.p1 TRINITY_DN14423_c0_g1~~TRINITY_DN14423_c0_g1_i1.p1  ORF type:complete len:466 (+),score=100.96 TRINITY_DN14423_c0_g1_i1:100-1497(+)
MEEVSDDVVPLETDDSSIVSAEKEISAAASSAKELRLKRLQTAAYCAAYIALGFKFGAVGPTVLLLTANLGVSQAEFGAFFIGRGVGWLIGCMVAGRLFQRFPGHRLIAISVLAVALWMIVLPFVKTLWLLVVMTAMVGFLASFMDVGTNFLTFQIWQEEANPYLQFLHFAFGIGAILAPFIVGAIVLVAPSGNELWPIYWTLAVLVGVCAILPIVVPSPTIAPDSSEKSEDGASPMVYSMRERVMRFVIVGLGAFTLFAYMGVEQTYGAWLVVYAVEHNHMPESEADFMSSAYWVALTLGRLAAVPIAARVSNRLVLLVDFIGVILSVGALVVFSFYSGPILIWIVTVTLGVSLASIFATIITLPTDLGMKISAKESSIFIVGASIGDLALPSFGSIVVGLVGPEALMWYVLACGVLSFAAFGVMSQLRLPRAEAMVGSESGDTVALVSPTDDDGAELEDLGRT